MSFETLICIGKVEYAGLEITNCDLQFFNLYIFTNHTNYDGKERIAVISDRTKNIKPYLCCKGRKNNVISRPCRTIRNRNQDFKAGGKKKHGTVP